MVTVFWSPDTNSRSIRKVPDAGKDWGKKKRVSEDEMARCPLHPQCNGHELGQTSGGTDGQGGLGCCGPWGHKESDTTERLNPNKKWYCIFNLGEISVVFSTVAASITFLPPVQCGSLFLYILTNICYLLSFWYIIILSLPVCILKTLLISLLFILFRGFSY